MGYELIITEKPAAALKIAGALSGRIKKQSYNGVDYYTLSKDGKEIMVACAVGHLYNLAEKKRTSDYPVFDIEWKASYEVSRESAFTKKYIFLLRKISKEATSFIIATDYDIEGELIGLNVLRFACNRKDAHRMKFSTLTPPDLRKAYQEQAPTLNWGQARAGETRHILDWIYGINISRALTSSVKKAGHYKLLSSGRVQGPAIKIIVEREREIQAFQPVPFWEVKLTSLKSDQKITASHIKGRFWKRDEAESAAGNAAGYPAVVRDLKEEEKHYPPPYPFDLTTLQLEAHRCLHFNPSRTLQLSQNLYLAGCISYPRTSSQKLPRTIGYEQIINALKEQPKYTRLCEHLKQPFKPNEGPRTDTAHPAIYPTGHLPESLNEAEQKLYDLIVRRFLACFSAECTGLHTTVELECNREKFIARGSRILSPGWQVFYQPFIYRKDELLPGLALGEKLKVESITMEDKETQPKKRFTQASIVRELFKRNLGTKATRALIIDTLFERGYIFDEPIKATELGIMIVDTLTKYCPSILDEELTRKFEEEMENIYHGKQESGVVLEDAKKVLTSILKDFREREGEIGRELVKAVRESWLQVHEIGLCKCGGMLLIKRGKFGNFAACSRYPECKVSFSLPHTGKIKATEKTCESCTYPVIEVIRRGSRPRFVCINPECGSKTKIRKAPDRKCPECSSELVVRHSIYGEFIGCSSYPKCRYTEKAEK